MSVTTPGQFIGYKLLHDADVIAITSTRIYNGDIPETVTTLPAINFYFISSSGAAGNEESESWQINCRSTTQELVLALAFLVKKSFTNICGTYSGFDVQNTEVIRQSILEEPNETWNAAVDITVKYIRV
jgi:hypothetical protein